MKLNFFSAVVLGLSFSSISAVAETGVTDKMITVGQVAPLSGPAAALGTGMKAGAMAFFKKTNAAGGINGKTINLISRDDGYEPEKTVENTNKLIDNEV